jgi:hypothetical protein
MLVCDYCCPVNMWGMHFRVFTPSEPERGSELRSVLSPVRCEYLLKAIRYTV